MIKEKMTNSDYHAHKAIGSTTLKLASHSLAKFKAELDGLIPKKESEAFDIGTAAHSAILEQDFSVYVEGPDAAKNTKEWKSFEAANKDKICLQPKHFSIIKGMYEAFYAHELASKITNKGRAELSMFVEIGGVQYKARTDYIVEDGDGLYIVDYKSAASAEFDAFQRAIGDYGYDISAAHYIKVVEEEFKKPVKEYYWIVQEKEAPFEIRVFRMDEECRSRSLATVEKLHEKVSIAMKTNEWPKRYPAEIMDIDLNSYAIAKGNQNE